MLAERVVIYGKEDVRIVQQEINENELGDREVLIKTEVSLISPGTELSRVFALKKGATYPVYPGYCSVGRVLKTGSAVETVKPDDRVVFSGSHASACIFDPEKSDGGVLFKIGEDADPVSASFMVMCWIATNGILPVDVKLQDNVAIMGMGTLGIITALYYQLMGCNVIGFENYANRCLLAEKMGVNNVYCLTSQQQIEKASEVFGPDGADIVVDASGNSNSIITATAIAGKYGQLVLLGSPREELQENVSVPFYAIHSKMLRVIGALNRRYSFEEQPGSRISMRRSLQYIEKLINEGKLPVRNLVSHVIRPDEKELMDSYRGLMYDKDHYTGVVIDWR